MPSTDVKPLALAPLAVVAIVMLLAPSAVAGPLGTTIPSNCIAHTSFSGGANATGDYRCAGLAIEFHTAGVANSPFPIWAGQWLFTDQAGQFRVGYCTFNRGNHPTIAARSSVVGQSLPLDPGGARSAYLSWRYGDTRDNLTAAALWAVFHYYAQDGAGTNRAATANAPLVPRLDGITADSGRSDLQAKALALHDEATRFGGKWTLTLSLTAEGVVTATLLSGATPVPGRSITVLMSGSDLGLVATTGPDGTATVTVSLPSGTVTVVATTSAPGPAVVYRGTPASPDPDGAQTLITAGQPLALRATAVIEVPPPATTTTTIETTTTSTAPTVPSTTTTTLPSTTVAPTTLPSTTTVAPAAIPETTTVPASTVAEGTTTTTTPPTPAPTTVLPATLPPVPAVVPNPPLPRTGGGGDGGVAYLATALLVGGIGLLGTLRRRDRLA